MTVSNVQQALVEYFVSIFRKRWDFDPALGNELVDGRGCARRGGLLENLLFHLRHSSAGREEADGDDERERDGGWNAGVHGLLGLLNRATYKRFHMLVVAISINSKFLYKLSKFLCLTLN
ncbi:MAG TPA: hypothetical protein EYP95_01600 [Nitrospinaceae bacterium]|nr:hypothetical protein [Nitrospinaceae bacterium]